MQVKAAHIRRAMEATYKLWGGEMEAIVHMYTCAYGFCSAAIIVWSSSNGMSACTYDPYTRPTKPTIEDTFAWVAEQLTRLSQGTMLAVGTECNVQGLRKAAYKM